MELLLCPLVEVFPLGVKISKQQSSELLGWKATNPVSECDREKLSQHPPLNYLALSLWKKWHHELAAE